jgi:hypothetical protein
MGQDNGGQLESVRSQSPLALRLCDAALSFRMPGEVQSIDTQDLKSRMRELRRFL